MRYFLSFFLIALFPCFSAQAEMRSQLYALDKQAAQAHFDSGSLNQCVAALQQRYPAQYQLKGELSYNDAVSKTVYDTLYWKGSGSMQRGVVYSGTVVDGGQSPATLLCYYSLTDHVPEFQDAFVMPHLPDQFASMR